MKTLDSNRFIEYLETGFQILFLVYTILGFNSVSFGTPIISFFMWVSFVLGGCLLFLRLLKWKEYIKMPGLILLVVMCTVCVLSILVNHQYNFKKNVIYLVFWVFYFFMYFAQNGRISVELVKKRFCMLGHVMCFSAFVLALLSLWMMFVRYSEVTHVNGSEVTRGFTYGRLFGAYLTPNGGAVVGSIVIFLSVYYIGKFPNMCYRVWAVLNMLVQFLYITFSDSRSGMLSLAFGGAVYVCFAILGNPRIKSGLCKGVVTLALTLVTLVCCMFAPAVAQDIYNDIVVDFSERLAQKKDNNLLPSETLFIEPASEPIESVIVPTESTVQQTVPPETVLQQTESVETKAQQTEPLQNDVTSIKPEEIIDSYMVDRGYDLSKDVSNRRFDVWKSGLEIFAKRPWLGTTFCGFLPFAQEHMPNTYIVSNDYLQMDTLDNDFVNLLVSNGIFGFLAFLAFVVWVLLCILRNYTGMRKKDPQIPVMMAVCMAAATFSLFTSGVLYMQSPFSVIFWLSLGGLIVIVSNGNEEKDHGW